MSHLEYKDKTKELRESYESIVDIKTYREHKGQTQRGYEFLYFKFKAAIAIYLGEKIR